MQKLLAVLKLKLLLLRGNWTILLMMTVSPIFFTILIGNVQMSGGHLIDVYINNQDQSAISAQLLNAFDQEVYAVHLVDESEIFAKVQDKSIKAGYIIPAGFAESLLTEGKAEIGVIRQLDASAPQAIPSILNAAALRIRSSQTTAEVVFAAVKQHTPVAKSEITKQVEAAVNAGWENRQVTTSFTTIGKVAAYDYDDKAQASMGYLVFFLMFTLTFSITEILEEKQRGTWQRMVSTPTKSWQIMGGHFLGTMMLGVLQVILLIGVGIWVMGVDWGHSPLGVLMILISLIFALTSLGLMLAGFIQSRRQLQALYPVLIVSTSMLGGCMWPLEIVPNFMKTFAYFIPQGQAMMGLTDIVMRGGGLEKAVQPTLALLAMGTVFFLLGLPRVQKETQN